MERGRKQWGQGGYAKAHIVSEDEKVKAVKEEVPAGYEEYLLLLQQRNRLVKKLKKKNNKEIELERKEQGFSLYVNGANTGARSRMGGKAITPSPRTIKPTPKPKTAGDIAKKRNLDMHDLAELERLEQEQSEKEKRAQTAPSKVHRKNWLAGSVQIKTSGGDKMKIKAPELLTGNYEDDFEEEELSNESDDGIDSEDEHEELTRHMSRFVDSHSGEDSSDLEIDASKFDQGMGNSEDKTAAKKEEEEEEDEDEISEHLMLSMDDVKKLRQSMELHASIQQSIAEEISSGEEETGGQSPIPRGVTEKRIAEVEEDVVAESFERRRREEKKHVPQSQQPVEKGKRQKPLEENPWAPGDMIVLEFGPSIGKRKERDLSSGKRRSLAEDTPNRKPQKEDSKPASKDVILAPDQPLRKPSRPLSASKKSKSTSSQLDSTVDRSAVLQAIQAENAEVEKYARDTKSAPSRQSQQVSLPMNSKSENVRPSSVTSKLPENKVPDAAENIPVDVSPPQLSEEKLTKVLKKVLQMEGKQQKKLLKALSKIEDTASAENSPRLSSEAMSKPNSQDVAGVEEQAISHSFDKKRGGSMKRQVAIDRVSPNPVQSEDIVELHLVLLSNWGHPSRIGLTEIQAFDSEGNRIDLTCGDVQVYGAKDCKGDLDNLFNGRFKTTKERNMWSCSFVPEKPVEITLNVKRGKDSSKEFGISKLRIWNYNKSLNELSVGVKAMQVFLGAELIFSGDIDKGCGNQVFDYSKTIILREDDTYESNQKGSDSAAVGSQLAQGRVERSMDVNRSVTVTLSDHSPTRPETRTLDHSTGNLQLPVVDDTTASTHVRASIKASISKETNQSTNPDPKVITAKSPKVSKRMAANFDPHSKDQPSLSPRKSDSNPKLSQSKSKQKNPKGIEKTPKADEKTITPEKKTSKASEKTPKSKEPVLATDVQDSVSDSMDGVSMLQQIQEITNSRAGSRSPSRPQWLESSVEASRPHGPSKPKEVPKWLKAEEITDPFIAPPESRAGSRSSAQPQTIDDALPMWPSAGVEALPTVLDPDTDGKRDRRKHTPDHVADENEELRWRQRQVSIDSDDEPPMKKIEQKRENHRNKMKHLKEFSLEESWTSLDLFSKSHKGRISVDFEGDALDEYLQLEKKQPFEPTIQEETGIEEDFMIPELPFGKELVINIKSTWGDKHYVGLNGIEIFSSKGVPVPVAKISANPPDINVLNDYGKDPRVAANLVDGINRTRDDIHMWLAPFTKGGNHFIYITFEEPCKVAMVRIWNYNKSRIHSYRGAKDVEMMLDGSFIFKGEIARACGGVMGGTEAFGDTILFTVDEEILEAVSLNDEAYEAEAFSEDEMEDDVPFERPKTADEENQDRPFTCAVGTRGRGKIETQDVSTVQPQDDHSHISYEGELVVYTGQCLQLNFTSTWGDHHYLGLTGLEVVGKDGEALPITMNMIDANPRDLHVLPGYETDDRTLDKLIDGTNITMSDEHMWLVPYTEGEDHLVTVDFGQPTAMVALRIWNYNKSAEDTYRGAQILHCTLDGKVISPPSGHLVRKGPGNCFFDFMQEIPFSRQPEEVTFPMLDGKMRQSKVVTEEPSQEYEAVQMPCGFIYQLHFLSTWGDPYYVGLNGLEFYDAAGNKIDLVENNIAAYPDSVNALDGVSNDVRTPDKLIDGVNDTTDGRHMWLAPILPSLMNRIFVIFDEPRTISMIKLWNYSKTPTRGVKDFALLVDDLLVYNGQIGPVQSVARGILPTCDLPQPYHTILFTDDKHIAQRERHTVIKKQAADQDIQLTNDMTVVSHFNNPKEATSQKTVNQALRPTTSVSNRNKKK
ncbi:protein KIAA0556 isoform X4 [Lingula anatina]|uniref:Protein KIAA0556 isoform X4 n=1 Tax=Lingula anatina TaxID=7574 RepID=A0A1S3H550_LINAN|nr:protein KIAA0556 isoform X4 [Lingula anatina]|eukprot:XP_013381133.1 protein KIAA0556 isoform X4 [Lingula anatina]